MSYKELSKQEVQYLSLLAKQFPNIEKASTEIINLEAILSLPKGTEHFISDIHGEYETFEYVLRNASGVIQSKIDQIFPTLSSKEKNNLRMLIYYPEETLERLDLGAEEKIDWYFKMIINLITITRNVSAKYTRSKVRKALPKDFAYIIDELLYEHNDDQQLYYNKIIQMIIKLQQADAIITHFCLLIQRFAIDHLHVIGDIFDRGTSAHLILDKLQTYHSVDIQWGNHDILWMGAAAGSEACICNAIRISLKYGNLSTLEDGYGINLRPLATFAQEIYKNDKYKIFLPSSSGADKEFSQNEKSLIAKMHKAITIIQFKIEAQIIKNRPHFDMQDRLLLEKIDFTNNTIFLNGKTYSLLDNHFPTINPNSPYELTHEEKELISQLKCSFKGSDKLQSHVKFLFSNGNMFLCHNNNLLYHGCILLNPDKTFKTLIVEGKKYYGKSLLERFERLARQGYFAKDKKIKKYGEDIMWYLWSGANSPLFGKKKMATFERYFIAEKETHFEEKNSYYALRDDAKTCEMILNEFGLNPENGHIINGHVPVKVSAGESPLKANGKLIVIDGGFSRAYQKVTGIAGYTLIYHSRGLEIVAHKPFVKSESTELKLPEITSESVSLEKANKRVRVRDTDTGKELQRQIELLLKLVFAYRRGIIKIHN